MPTGRLQHAAVVWVGTVGTTLGGALYIMLRVVRATPGVGGSVTHESGAIGAHDD